MNPPAATKSVWLYLAYLAPMAVFLVLVGFLAAGLRLNPRDIGSTLIDKPAPAFELSEVTRPNEKFSQRDWLGKVSLINVWASWCVSCRQEHPLLMEISKRNMVPLYGLNWKDTTQAANDWLQRHGNPYLASAFDPTGRAGIDYGVTGTPETFLVDKQGIIRYKHTGPISLEVFEKTLWPAIQELQGKP